MSVSDIKHYFALLAEIDREGDGLTEWETLFVESMTLQKELIEAGRQRLTDKQKEQIDRIYDQRVCR